MEKLDFSLEALQRECQLIPTNCTIIESLSKEETSVTGKSLEQVCILYVCWCEPLGSILVLWYQIQTE